jgi:hypothetical protein
MFPQEKIMKSTISLVALLLAGALPIAATAAEPAKHPAMEPGPATSQPAAGDAAEPAKHPAMEPSPATSQPAPGDAGRTEVPPRFKELDRDKDGQISKDEAKVSAEIEARFETLDSDRNGKVSLIEWAASEKM